MMGNHLQKTESKVSLQKEEKSSPLTIFINLVFKSNLKKKINKIKIKAT